MNYEDFIEDYYKLSTYVSCYSPQFQPVPHKDYWITPVMPILHPDPSLLRKPDRPKSSRYHNEMDWREPSSQVQCGFCGQRGELGCIRKEAVVQCNIPLHHNILPLLQVSGFYGVARLGFIQLDWHLITALVERWRSETHTFHMPIRECTITLQDVEVLLGIPVDGESIISQLCKPSKRDVRDIAGPLILLQIWAWKRFPTIAPQLTHANDHLLSGRALGSRWRDQFCVTRSATHVVSQYSYIFDLLQCDQRSNNARLRDVADDPQGRVRVEEVELDEVYHKVKEVPPMTQTQSQTGYGVGPSSSYMDVDLSTSYMHGHERGYEEHNEYLYHEAPADVSDRQEYQQEPENQEDREQHRVQSRRRQPAQNRRRPGCGTH
ncbi:serine/threonine-protein phosphatase 7 long form-like protein [Cucumis melo var. makuwa]|uniref:Serine/threonine-protein phosphatase 7 long form-like protein n=1 Tax=Cucumis melo var. makuwa TaxID=1194695 RepID=A0A5A7SN49_CUCMM|nr:serine/threonine-protein phosphatase 7 long form-like protein [Cucumis melo var. makuwa]